MNNETSTDKRVARTRAALRDAFVDLVLSKPYDDISVNEIIEKAGIGRSTFYQHYTSKDHILASSLQGPMSIIANSILPDSTTERLEAILEHFWDQRQFARVIFTGTSRKHVLNSLTTAIEKDLSAYCRTQNARCIIPLSLASATIAEAQITLMVSWLTGKASCSLREITQVLDKVSKALISALTQG